MTLTNKSVIIELGGEEMKFIIGGYDFTFVKYESSHKYAFEIYAGIKQARAEHTIQELIDMNEFELSMFKEIEKACTDEALNNYISRFCGEGITVDDFKPDGMASSFAYDVVMMKLSNMQKKLDEFLETLKEDLR